MTTRLELLEVIPQLESRRIFRASRRYDGQGVDVQVNMYGGGTAKSTVFFQKCATCATTNHQPHMQDNKNLVIPRYNFISFERGGANVLGQTFCTLYVELQK